MILFLTLHLPWFIPCMLRNTFIQKSNKKSDQTLLSHTLSHACSSILNRESTGYCLCNDTEEGDPWILEEGDPWIRVWEHFGSWIRSCFWWATSEVLSMKFWFFFYFHLLFSTFTLQKPNFKKKKKSKL